MLLAWHDNAFSIQGSMRTMLTVNPMDTRAWPKHGRLSPIKFPADLAVWRMEIHAFYFDNLGKFELSFRTREERISSGAVCLNSRGTFPSLAPLVVMVCNGAAFTANLSLVN